MFDTMKVARKIREARIVQNMTQVNLADSMEVSYQAVSNWERGNSMPDIAKLEQLCRILDITMDELLGAESSRIIDRVQDSKEDSQNQEALTCREIQEVAVILPPRDVEKLVEESVEWQGKERINLSAMVGMAPFLDSEYLESLILRAHVDSLKEVTGLAPFVSVETLDRLAMNADPEEDMKGIVSLAPFLSREALDLVTEKVLGGDGEAGGFRESLIRITGLAPFLDQEKLNRLAMKANPEEDMKGIVSLAPFLSHETLDLVTEKVLGGDGEAGGFRESLIKITGLAPFLDQEKLNRLAMKANPEEDMKGIVSLAPFLSHETLDLVTEKVLGGDGEAGGFRESLIKITGLAPFLDQEKLNRLAMKANPEEDMKGIISLAPFLSQETLKRAAEKRLERGGDISGLCPFLPWETMQYFLKK